MTAAHRRLLRNAILLVALGTISACSRRDPDDSPWAKRVKPPAYHADSTRVVTLAMRALGDSVPMRVDAMTRGDQGWQVRLLPRRGGTAGGGMVWVDANDSSVTVVKRY